MEENREILESAKAKMDTLEPDEILEAKSMLESIAGYPEADELAEKCERLSDAVNGRDESLNEIFSLDNKILGKHRTVSILKIICIILGAVTFVCAVPLLIAGAAVKMPVLIAVGIILANVGFIGMILCIFMCLMKTSDISALLSDKSEVEKEAMNIYNELAEMGYAEDVYGIQ